MDNDSLTHFQISCILRNLSKTRSLRRGPSCVVNNVCSSVYANDYVVLYCDQGDRGPGHRHGASMRGSRTHCNWKDTNPYARNDPKVMDLANHKDPK